MPRIMGSSHSIYLRNNPTKGEEMIKFEITDPLTRHEYAGKESRS